MSHDLPTSTAARSYAVAHDTHYGSKDLRCALGLYEELMAAHPDSAEAGYSRAQIQNICRAVIPRDELLAAEAALTRSHLGSVGAKEGAQGSSDGGEDLEAL